MRIKLKFAEVHTAVFLQGFSLGPKLNPVHKEGLGLEYDDVKDKLYVSYNNNTAIVPMGNIVCMLPSEPYPPIMKADPASPVAPGRKS